MSKIQVYTGNGKAESVDFPKERFIEPNVNLLSQANFVYEDRSHKGTSKVKTRAEINATTAKVYKQKGTGNARHGSRRAPLFKGGGVTHGPKAVKRILSLSKKLKKRAFDMALSAKVAESKAVLVDKLGGLTKTKEAQQLINKVFSDIKIGKDSRVVLALGEGKNEVVRVFRNIKNVAVLSWKDLGLKDILDSGLLLIDKEAFSAKQEPKTKKTETPKAMKKPKVEKPVKTAKKPVAKKKVVVKSK